MYSRYLIYLRIKGKNTYNFLKWSGVKNIIYALWYSEIKCSHSDKDSWVKILKYSTPLPFLRNDDFSVTLI